MAEEGKTKRSPEEKEARRAEKEAKLATMPPGKRAKVEAKRGAKRETRQAERKAAKGKA